MLVTWTTFNKTESRVDYGLLGGRLFEMSAKGEWTLFVDSGVEKRKMFIHRVTLTGLKPAATYGGRCCIRPVCQKCFSLPTSFCVMPVYHCGSEEGWSDVLVFTALNDSSGFSPRFALYGDLGNENPQSLARLQKETQLGMYDVILHIGACCRYSGNKEMSDGQQTQQSLKGLKTVYHHRGHKFPFSPEKNCI